ncbi:MAG: radical SAM protein [Phycisphaerae bacterium]
MKLLLIAMSGVRAWSEELNAIGLTMPGVIERKQVVASMPSLGLLTLAGMTDDDVDVTYHEIADLRKTPQLPDGFDLVAISSFTAQIKDAYQVAAHYRAAGTPVIMGGLHVTVLPDEAARHCTSIVVGEAEPVWHEVIADARRGELRPRYAATNGHATFNLDDSPMPRFSLLDIDKYNRIPVQTSRGCPHSCDFCASSILLTPRYSVKPVEHVIAEIHEIKRHWSRPFLEFADDNSFVHRKHYKNLLREIAKEDVKWFTEADVSVAEDADLIDLMRASGCRQALIGLESPRSSGLDGVETRRNWKLKMLDRYEAAVRAIQSRGVTVNGCFILGLDGEGPEVFDAIYDFADRTNLFEIQITVMTPFPGTPLYARLEREGRLLAPGAWERCTLFDVNFIPTNMSPEELQQGLVDLGKRLYDPTFVQKRREGYFANLDRSIRHTAHGTSNE